jgi:hypothetical protein
MLWPTRRAPAAPAAISARVGKAFVKAVRCATNRLR